MEILPDSFYFNNIINKILNQGIYNAINIEVFIISILQLDQTIDSDS